MLNIFHSGALIYVLTAVFLLLESVFVYQLIKGQRSGSVIQDLDHGPQYSKKPVAWYKNPFTWYALATLVLFIWAVSSVASDYKGQ